MNLTTHWVLALAIGIGFFHNVQIAMVMSIGALIPDLDREYLFVAKDFIGRHQLHRSLFHNFFVIGLLYLWNPFLSLGALTHSALDMFTSATDRGVELLFPLTRLVKSFHYDIEGNLVPDHQKEAEWWVEDPWTLMQKTTDRDLREPTGQAWRRSYGPFKNSRVFDWGIFFGSIIFLAADYAVIGSSSFSLSGYNPLVFISLAGIGIFYGLGEWWRRKLLGKSDEQTNHSVLGILFIGLVLFVIGAAYLLQPPQVPDLRLAAVVGISTLVGLAAGYVLVKLRKSYNDLSL
ncbi:MAG: metal-dependent hydrolase [Thaumarchaeota archaeon]|nr:metal-dependent hydrolase [Nitrososphaerota archaeon]